MPATMSGILRLSTQVIYSGHLLRSFIVAFNTLILKKLASTYSVSGFDWKRLINSYMQTTACRYNIDKNNISITVDRHLNHWRSESSHRSTWGRRRRLGADRRRPETDRSHIVAGTRCRPTDETSNSRPARRRLPVAVQRERTTSVTLSVGV